MYNQPQIFEREMVAKPDPHNLLYFETCDRRHVNGNQVNIVMFWIYISWQAWQKEDVCDVELTCLCKFLHNLEF